MLVRGLWKRRVAAGWYTGVGITLLIVATPPALLASTSTRVAVGAVSALCFVGAGYEWWIRRNDETEATKGANAVDSDEWTIDFPGQVADIRVLYHTLQRYALAHDVTIINRSNEQVVLTAELLVQWANRPLYCVAKPHESALDHWSTVLTAFGFTAKQQLLFPLNLNARSAVSGHIVFDIADVGMGVGTVATEAIGGLRQDLEHEREREYKLQIRNKLTYVERTAEVRTVYAPRLDGSGIADRTDFAVAGRAVTLNLMPRVEPPR